MRRGWLQAGLGVAAVLALVGAHLVAFGIISVRLAMPVAVIAGVALAAVAIHLGVLGPLSVRLRNHFHPRQDGGAPD